MITIDGYEWDVPCDVERAAEMTPSEISGLMLDRSYFNDVLGTYMRYDLTLAVPPSREADYATLYETLTAPVDAHSFVLPYNQDTITLTARVESVQDVLVYTRTRKQYWRGIKFSVIANHPTKTLSLGEVISRGKSPLPEVIGLPIGSLYVLTEDGWEDADIPYANGVSF